MSFIARKLSEDLVEAMLYHKIYSDNCPVHHSDLRLLTLSYYDFNNNVHNDGKMIVYKGLSDATLNIFKILFYNRFPIEKIKLVNEYNGSDEASMADNNTSAFNCRFIAGTNKFSIHSYGMAIDLNPKQNPYIAKIKENLRIYPESGAEFLNRAIIRVGMVETILEKEGKSVIDVFRENGFTEWGGDWNHLIDWHHFQVPRDKCEEIAMASKGAKFY